MSDAVDDRPARIRLGVIARPHGLAGQLAVTLDAPGSTTLQSCSHLFLAASEEAQDPQRFSIRRAGPGRKGQALVTLEGVATLEAAEALRGKLVLVEREQIPLEEGEVLFSELIGLAAVDPSGAPLGSVVEVVDSAEVPILVLRLGARERFVPFVESCVRELDPAAGRLVLVPLPEDEA